MANPISIPAAQRQLAQTVLATVPGHSAAMLQAFGDASPQNLQLVNGLEWDSEEAVATFKTAYAAFIAASGGDNPDELILADGSDLLPDAEKLVEELNAAFNQRGWSYRLSAEGIIAGSGGVELRPRSVRSYARPKGLRTAAEHKPPKRTKSLVRIIGLEESEVLDGFSISAELPDGRSIDTVIGNSLLSANNVRQVVANLPIIQLKFQRDGQAFARMGLELSSEHTTWLSAPFMFVNEDGTLEPYNGHFVAETEGRVSGNFVAVNHRASARSMRFTPFLAEADASAFEKAENRAYDLHAQKELVDTKARASGTKLAALLKAADLHSVDLDPAELFYRAAQGA